ncbi:MAG TPA: hypothetical protein VGN83_20910 [Falsiroseomonas sp.]|jgi:hypothetical protein|nr:hypothetical protein [Falsiroseomonas sp.]
MSDAKSPRALGDGRGDFFAVDRRAWAFVCGLGMNPAVAHLALARGTGGDNRTTSWSANAIEQRTGISRSRAAQAIAELERSKAVFRDPAGKRDHPRYKIVPAHEIPGCEGCPPPALHPEQQRVLDQLGDCWTLVPQNISPRQREEHERWGTRWPGKAADQLVTLGRATRDGARYRAVRYDAEAAARSDWIWLPNALVDGAAGETAPVELVRQTGSVATLRLLVDLYGAQTLDEDGGVHFRRVRESYERHRVGEQGPFVVWGFVPAAVTAWPDAPFVAPYLAGTAGDKDRRAVAWEEFGACWNRLRTLGLVEMVAHLVHADTADGEILHPMALEGTGLDVERELAQAALRAALTMLTPGQYDWARRQGVVALAPVLRHIEGVQLVGVARLRYRPRTSRTRTFAGREADWREAIARLEEIARAAGRPATSRYIKDDQRASKKP